MRVLVTGSSGQLGRVFCRDLLRDGFSVEGFDLVESPDGDIRTTVGSVLDLTALRQSMKDKDAVVHLAAIMSRYRRPEHELFSVNVQGTWNVFQVAKEFGIRRGILISSECVTGLCFQRDEHPPAYLPVDTEHPLRPSEPYGFSKMLQEKVAHYYSTTINMSVVILRPLYVIDTWDPERIAMHQELFHPDLWGWVHPEDVAAAISAALRSNIRFDIFFVGAKTTVCSESTVELITRRFGIQIDVKKPELYEGLRNAAIFDTAKLEQVLGVSTRSSLWSD